MNPHGGDFKAYSRTIKAFSKTNCIPFQKASGLVMYAEECHIIYSNWLTVRVVREVGGCCFPSLLTRWTSTRCSNDIWIDSIFSVMNVFIDVFTTLRTSFAFTTSRRSNCYPVLRAVGDFGVSNEDNGLKRLSSMGSSNNIKGS